MYDVQTRERKARTMVAVLGDFLGLEALPRLSLLNVGGSAGIIDNYLSNHFSEVVGLDIDLPAVEFARSRFNKNGLTFVVGDALRIPCPEATFDVVVCSQVYEHVPDARVMLDEIYRVLKPGGTCYFAANNRLMWNEPHYNLPLLSVVPRWLAHIYIRVAGKASFYYEKHYTYWGLRSLVRRFDVHDYTLKIVQNPSAYSAGYMVKPGSYKSRIAVFVARYLKWLSPGYIWALQKTELRG